MARPRKVSLAIARAERILPGREVRTGIDPRWKAIIAVGEYIKTDPVAVCDFAMKWARRRGRDLQAAIYCCLTEHLLEHHFDLLFPRMRAAARSDARVAKHFMGVSSSRFLFGQAKQPKNIRRLKHLERELCRLHPDLA